MDDVVAVTPYAKVIIVNMGSDSGHPVTAKNLWFEGEGVV